MTYSSADGTFGLSYVTPPWVVQLETQEILELIIPTEVFGVALDGSPPTHGLRAGRVDQTPGVGDLSDAAPNEDPLDIPDGFDFGSFPTVGDDSSSTGAMLPDLPDGVPDLDEIPDYLLDVDLANPRDVAFAELNFLIDQKDADLDSELTAFLTGSGQEGMVFQVVMDPGVFIRSFYFVSSQAAVRVVFVSLFDLETRDLDLMAETIHTDGAPEAGP